MALKPGTKLGPYEISAPIGAGGMGAVYRATDTKLRRDVAIKVLPDDVAQDKERLARFEREALLLASLNHPNIASIYGLEESDGQRCLVLELVEGQTLAERISAGPLPVDETLSLAQQMASALEAAHQRDNHHVTRFQISSAACSSSVSQSRAGPGLPLASHDPDRGSLHISQPFQVRAHRGSPLELRMETVVLPFVS